MGFSILYIFIAAFLVRLVAITQSLWLDEAITANVVKNLDYAGILKQFSPTDFHPPLYYLFMKLWTSLFGYSEMSMRMPSVLFSLVAGWFVYKTAVKLSNKAVAYWSAVFFLFNPLIIYYSQEARMYMMVTMWLSMAVYFFSNIVREKKLVIKDLLLFKLVCALAICTFYGSLFFIAGMYLYLLFKKRVDLVLATLPSVILAVVILFPLLASQLAHSKIALAQISNWNMALGLPNIKNLLLIPLKFVSGRISFDPKIVYYALSGLSLIAIGFFTAKGAYKKRWLAFILVAPLVIAFIVSFFLPMLQYFRFLYLIPVLALLLGLGTKTFTWERAIVTGIFFFFSILYLAVPNFHREDWKHILISVPQSSELYMIPTATDPIQYYYPSYKPKNLLELKTIPAETKEMYIIPYTADIYGFNYREVMAKNKFGLKDQQNYRGVTLEYWVR